MAKEFFDFLKKYGIIGLAIAVVIGGKVNDFVKVCVDDLIMPLISPLFPNGNWREAVLQLGQIKLGIGHFLGAALDFVIVAGLVFLFAKKVLREEVVEKK
jgi:large conductance mechanosensitive channel